MVRTVLFVCCVGLWLSGTAAAQQPTKVFGQELTKAFGPARVTEPWEAIVFTEAVPNSDIPVDITLLETVDGLFTPIGIRKPKGRGPFPIVLFFTGNGGSGLAHVRDYIYNRAYTMERFLAEGFAVAFLNYRAESWFTYTVAPPLRVGKQQANQATNRPVLEYDDLMTIVEYVKRLPYVDPDRVGLCGNSHGGGMILRAAADGIGARAAVVSEPDASEFLEMKESVFSPENPIYRTPESIAPHLDKKAAMERIRRITMPILLLNRDQDELQGVFETVYLWMKEAGKNIERTSYDHPVHGYIIRVPKDEKGVYHPDKIQLQAIQQALDFFKKQMAPQS
ncbi:MAG TPA: prolyl oligopeptidase family serine peptidase [Vicinamibacterales bacterium]|nr:prolyl oligopeptidase family serine peptidase [Vicinamibacterales bacterium]